MMRDRVGPAWTPACSWYGGRSTSPIWVVDPKDENKVFKAGGNLLLSIGGKSFQNTAGSAHGDHHDIWISPDSPNLVFTGDEGGLWRSQDGGAGWEHMDNLPIAQFYHLSV